MAKTNAERQKAYRDRRNKLARAHLDTLRNSEAVANEFVRLKSFADQLERENAALKEKLESLRNGTEITKLKAKIDKLKLENADLKRKHGKSEAEAQRLRERLREEAKFRSWGNPMTAAQFNAILKCLHPDTVHRLGDAQLTKKFNEATALFNSLRSQLVK